MSRPNKTSSPKPKHLPSALASHKKNGTKTTKRVRFWHAAPSTTTSAPPPTPSRSSNLSNSHFCQYPNSQTTTQAPVALIPDYSATPKYTMSQEWVPPPCFPSTNNSMQYPGNELVAGGYACCQAYNRELYHQIYTLQSQLYHWQQNSEAWQRRCDEVAAYERKQAAKASEDQMAKMRATIHELQRQKSVLSARLNRYKELASSRKSEPKKRSSMETPKHQAQQTSIMLLPRCEQSPRPLKKRRFRICTEDEAPSTPPPPRCSSPPRAGADKAPQMPICITPLQDNTRKFV